MKKTTQSTKTSSFRYITPGVYRIRGTGRKVYIRKSPSRRVVYLKMSSDPADLSYFGRSKSKKIPTKEVKPGIFELQYTPSESILKAINTAD